MSPARISSDAIVFKIDASQCELRIGDRVLPETLVGRDFNTGEMIEAGCHGRVVAVSFSEADHALIILVESESG